MAGGHREQPKLEKYVLLTARDELIAVAMLLRHRWYVFLGLAVLFVHLVSAYDPLAPRKVRMATGQTNSTLEALATRYEQILARHGVVLEKVPSKGAIENLALLESGKVDVALSQGGAARGDETRSVYIASIGYQPFWFFHRGPRIAGDAVWRFMREHQVSIGQEGSGTRRIFDAIMESAGGKAPAGLRTVELGASESARALIEGQIGGMFLLASGESGNARVLLEHPDIQVLDFPFAQALAAQNSYLEVVKLHRGALGLDPILPKADISMVATTTTLVGRDGLHPAIEQLLLRASVEIAREDRGMFARPGGFPTIADKSLPQSEMARHYLTNGPPALESRVPFWLSSLLDRTWFWTIALAAVAYPLLGFLPRVRLTMFGVLVSYFYAEVFEVHRQADEIDSFEAYRRLKAEADALTSRVNGTWVPKGGGETFVNLLNAVDLMNKRLEEEKSRIRDT